MVEEWINVKERKPDVYETVIVWARHKEDMEADRMLMGHRMYKSKWRVGVWDCVGEDANEWKITHWMPVLEGPDA